MRIYNIKDIKNIKENGILFEDGIFISFEKCRYEWAKEECIDIDKTSCVGIRNIEEIPPYFILYAQDKIKIEFRYRGILAKNKSKKKFIQFQMLLNEYGYTSYDCS